MQAQTDKRTSQGHGVLLEKPPEAERGQAAKGTGRVRTY